MRKFFKCIFCCFFSLVLLTGCGDETAIKSLEYNKGITESLEKDTVICENSYYKLLWDSTSAGVILEDVKTKKQWGTSPVADGGVQYDEFGMPIKRHPQVESALKVVYLDTNTGKEQTALSYTGAVTKGDINCQKINNGVEIEYYFDDAKIMIPVRYILFDNGVNISIDPNKIQENDNQITQISVAPFMASVENDKLDSYLFYPSGSGALILPKTVSQTGAAYKSPVYGEDIAIGNDTSTSITQKVALPVYGVKNGSEALFAVIDGAAESSIIETTVGATSFGYSSVYATFQMRGYYNHKAVVYIWNTVHRQVFADKIDTVMSVSFYPLSDNNANYSGMAKFYQNLLIEKEKMPLQSNENALNLNIIGGTMINKSFLGIPYTKLYPTTTLENVKEIISTVSKQTVDEFTVKLKGFGETGIDIGKIAGGFTIAKDLGGKSAFNNLADYCAKNNIDLFTEFNLVGFSKNSDGYNTYLDCADNSGKKKVKRYEYKVALRDINPNTKHSLLRREQLVSAAEKLLKKTDSLKLYGIDISLLSNMAYSDYGNEESSKYYAKSYMADDVKQIISMLKKSNKKISSVNANVYAAVNSDIILDTPTSSDKADIFEYDVPFYSMVFKGCVPIVSQPINSAENSNILLLQAIESGCSLNYNIIYNWDNTLIDADYPLFFATEFKSVKQNMFKTINSLSDFYKKINGQKITAHNVLSDGLRETVYENGTRIYVNYSDKELMSPVGKVAPYSYIVGV